MRFLYIGAAEQVFRAAQSGATSTDPRVRRFSHLCAHMRELYGDGEVGVLRAPARINILGEHVDYVRYLDTASVACASDAHEMTMMYRPAPDPRVRGASTLPGCAPFEVDLRDAPELPAGRTAEAVWNEYLAERPAPHADWGNYVRGAALFERLSRGAAVARGFDFVVDSSIPPAGGASSSSALTVLAAAALIDANDLERDGRAVAEAASRAEWFTGTRGGSLDHLTICLSRAGHALHIEYATLATSLVALPPGPFRWVTFFSTPADKGRSVRLEYNARAAAARVLIPALLGPAAQGSTGIDLDRLPRETTFAELETRRPEIYRACAAAFPELVAERRAAPLPVRAFAEHHAGERRRVQDALAALAGLGPAEAMRAVGLLLDACHESLRDLYEVSMAEVESLRGAIRAHPDVLGARLMGGGFGGNVLALAATPDPAGLVAAVQSAYYAPRGRDALAEGSVMVSSPGDGLRPL
jgi:galactokinase